MFAIIKTGLMLLLIQISTSNSKILDAQGVAVSIEAMFLRDLNLP